MSDTGPPGHGLDTGGAARSGVNGPRRRRRPVKGALLGLAVALALLVVPTPLAGLTVASIDPTPSPSPSAPPSPEPTSSPTPCPHQEDQTPLSAAPSGEPEPEETPTPEPEPSPSPCSDAPGDPEAPPAPAPTPDPDPEPSEPPPPGDDGKEDPGGGDRDGRGSGRDRDRQERQRQGRSSDGQPQPADQPFVLGGPQSTARLVTMLAGLGDRGVSLEQALLEVVGPFPVAGLAWWTDDWHAPRCCPSPHQHQGLDMFAPQGTPVVAAADGYVSKKVSSPAAAGLGLEIIDADGVEYFYAHLSAFALGVDVGDRVEVGQLIGYVGTTGNARGTIPHLHFEVQPGGVPVPPKPYVDSWLRLAERRAAELVWELTGRAPTGMQLEAFRLSRLLDLMGLEAGSFSQDEGSADGMLILAGVNPGTVYELARETAAIMAWEIDWGEEAFTESGQEVVGRGGSDSLEGILESPAQARQWVFRPEEADAIT